PELAEERTVDDEVGIAADRRGEVTVGRARKPGVAEVGGVVASLLERAQHESGERRPSPAGLLDVLGHTARDRAGQLGGDLRRELVRDGRGRDVEGGKLPEKPRD